MNSGYFMDLVTPGFTFGSSSFLRTKQWLCPGGPWLRRDKDLHKSCSSRWSSRTAHTGGPALHPASTRRLPWHRVLGWWDMQLGVLTTQPNPTRCGLGSPHSGSSQLPPHCLKTPSSTQHHCSHAACTGRSYRYSQGRQVKLHPCSSCSSSCSSQHTRNLCQVPHGCPSTPHTATGYLVCWGVDGCTWVMDTCCQGVSTSFPSYWKCLRRLGKQFY